MAKDDVSTVLAEPVVTNGTGKAAAVATSLPYRFKTRIPVKEGRDLFKLFGEMTLDDALTVVPLAVKVIESWDFGGDPSDPAAYDDLDLFDLLRLYRDLTALFNDRLKN